MSTAPVSPVLRRLSVVGVLVALLALGACGGDDSGAGVASLEGSSSNKSATTEAPSKEDTEAQLQKWVECMRDNGVDIPDPTTDEDGNLTLRPPGGGPGGDAGGASTDSQSTDSQNTDDQPQPIDRDQMDAAREECGDPPQGAMGGFDRGNSQEFQDAALEFAQCMRDNGVDMPDPTFDQAPAAGGARPEGGPRMFGSGIDQDDPTVQKAMEACSGVMPQPPGGGGPQSNSSGSASSDSSASSDNAASDA